MPGLMEFFTGQGQGI